jgi:hypothetical protein
MAKSPRPLAITVFVSVQFSLDRAIAKAHVLNRFKKMPRLDIEPIQHSPRKGTTMIPASYFYKDIYRQTWLDPDLVCAWERQSSHIGGHPIGRLFTFVTTAVARLVQQPKPLACDNA